MAVEHARAHALPKPWGVADLRPWNTTFHGGNAIGEIWYERTDTTAAPPKLLLKILFTNEPLSIQVHPDDSYARSMGLDNGKSEAWYVLHAQDESIVALGLTRRRTSQQLRHAVDDGSISDLIAWQRVKAGDCVFVAAGTIHAIGAGLVIAEIQQRSDATFRLFDHGRGRELHVDHAIAVCDARPADITALPVILSDERTLLTSNAHFTFERLELAPHSVWKLQSDKETWLLVIGGDARAGSFDIKIGSAIFLQSDCIDIRAGQTGLAALVAYPGRDVVTDLLRSTVMDTAE